MCRNITILCEAKLPQLHGTVPYSPVVEVVDEIEPSGLGHVVSVVADTGQPAVIAIDGLAHTSCLIVARICCDIGEDSSLLSS